MRTETRIKKLTERFVAKFETNPTEIFLSPGRIELIGNHTDHNNGKVMVSSVNLNILATVAKRDDGKIVFYSKGYRKMELNIHQLKLREHEFGTSKALIRGVVAYFRNHGYRIGGFSVCSDSTIYSGAGVSSSAAFEVLVGKILSYYYNNDSIDPFVLAQAGQYAESVYFNKPCGLLDQSGIALGGINYIDFKNTSEPEIENLKVDIKGYQFILINTGDDHSKLTPCYASIKDDMKSVCDYFNKSVLREVDERAFYAQGESIKDKCGERAYLRAKHYFEENERVAKALEALKEKDFKTFLKMMDDSGSSSYYQLRNCYVSREEEKLPKALKYVKVVDPTCYSRVHGGGFAGTMLMIVEKDKSKDIIETLKEHFGAENVMKVSLTSEGTSLYKKL